MNRRADLPSLLQPGICEESVRSVVRAVMFPRCSWICRSALKSRDSWLLWGSFYKLGRGRARPQYGGMLPRLAVAVLWSGARLPEILPYNLSWQLRSFGSLLLAVPMVKPFKGIRRDFSAENPCLGNSLLVAVCCGRFPKVVGEVAT